MKIITKLQTLSVAVLVLTTLLILGADPGTNESSMYEYEHMFDMGHMGWYLIGGWVISLGLLIVTTSIIHRDKIKQWWS